jgi:hypothetical protein
MSGLQFLPAFKATTYPDIYADTLHLNPKGYEILNQQITEILKKAAL